MKLKTLKATYLVFTLVFGHYRHSLVFTHFNVSMLSILLKPSQAGNLISRASVLAQTEVWASNKQTVFEYVLVCVMLFTHLQEMSQTGVCENRLSDTQRGVLESQHCISGL